MPGRVVKTHSTLALCELLGDLRGAVVHGLLEVDLVGNLLGRGGLIVSWGRRESAAGTAPQRRVGEERTCDGDDERRDGEDDLGDLHGLECGVWGREGRKKRSSRRDGDTAHWSEAAAALLQER